MWIALNLTHKHDGDIVLKRTTIAIAAQLALLNVAIPAFAQSADAPAGAASSPSASKPQELQTVVITGTKRAENLQNVAASVGAISGEDLKAMDIKDITTLSSALPSISFNDSGSSGRTSSLAIRGIGTFSFSDAVEPSVGLVVDGVVMGRTAQGLSAFLDVDRVEILRGPQGTLFGKNSSAGVINIVTADPNLKRLTGDVEVGTSSYDERHVEGAVSVPMSEGVAATRVAFSKGRMDGYVDNILDGRKFGGYDQSAIRVKTLLQPTASRKILLSADYSEQLDHNGARVAVLPQVPANDVRGLDGQYLSGIIGPENTETNTNGVYNHNSRFQGASAQWDERLGDHTLTSITAYRQGNTDDAFYGQVPNDPYLLNRTTLGIHQASEELRIASPTSGPFDYVAGLYLYKQGITSHTLQYADAWALNKAVPVRNLILASWDNYADTNISGYAAFGQANYRLSDKLTLLGGLRWTHESIDMNVANVGGTYTAVNGATMTYKNLGAPPGTFGGSATTKRPSWQFGGRYEASKDLTAYVTLSQGFKGAAFNSTSASNTPELVKPEIATSLEAGFKSRLFNNRAKVNVSVFSTDFKNFQTQAVKFGPTSGSTVVAAALINAEKLRTRGLEFDTEALLTEGWWMGLNGAFIDARYAKFTTGPCYPTLIAAGGCPAGYRDLSGGVLAGQPKTAFNLSVKKDLDLGSFPYDADIRAIYSWKSKIEWDAAQDPEAIEHAYGTLGVTLGIHDRSDRWSVNLFGKNLTNQFHATLRTWAFWGGRIQQIVPPDYQRTWGASLTYKF